ncbi:M15 family metallopeptidase [Anaerorhabdus furcosa]|uniref:D-alanyl-D-alanine dipeptidase/carboxypeptidase n=1 Tax=Anaerorhabdus furcosa TaxID=118967 RepID=A0A1T4P4Q4_9FIRM|nr:M15 family metallopeptidase [Anaerorhabdus furcosa]SJZ86535.1 D-alanyl-D-alanine dipeptidase/carboxypeptidase [Anaerorhabdus furcosa]
MKTIKFTKDMIHDGYLILVNPNHYFHENSSLLDLVQVNDNSMIYLNSQTNEALNQLMKEIDGWSKIQTVSGYRSKSDQTQLYNQSLIENGQTFTESFVALPGCSEHQTGLAIDLALKSNDVDFICPDFPYEGICQAFREMAPHYGFIERYGKNKEKITSISHEPWHFRYVGLPHSLLICEKNFCLEEYCEWIKQFKQNENPLHVIYNDKEYEVGTINSTSNTIELEVEEHMKWSLSGDNVEGFIYAKWK